MIRLPDLAVIRGETVSKRRWVSEEHFALGRLTPGTNLLAFCVGIGWILRRWAGAVVALLAASIPCTLFVVVITVLFAERQENPSHRRRSKGAIAAAVAVTVKTVWTIAHPHFRPGKPHPCRRDRRGGIRPSCLSRHLPDRRPAARRRRRFLPAGAVVRAAVSCDGERSPVAERAQRAVEAADGNQGHQ